MSLKELHDRITHALQTITADILHRVWDEFDYSVDVCRVTQGYTHWRIVINARETWTVAAADGVRCAHVRWGINFLLTFETAPFFCVHPVGPTRVVGRWNRRTRTVMTAMMMMMMMIVLNSEFIVFHSVDDKETFYMVWSHIVMKLLNLISQIAEFNRVFGMPTQTIEMLIYYKTFPVARRETKRNGCW